MRRAAPVILALAVAATAVAGDMTLTRLGTFYQAVREDAGIIVTERHADGTSRGLLVPATAGIEAESIQVAADGASDVLFVLWQVGAETDARIDLAVFSGEVWYGPYTIAGGDGTGARNPEMLLHRATVAADWVDDDGNPVTEQVDVLTLHLAWWQQSYAGYPGVAVYASLPVDADGVPAFDQLDPLPLADLLPYGVNCHGLDDATKLTWPRLFVDPQSGSPHVMATDLGNCLIQILELETTLDDQPDVEPKRRRTVVVFRQQEMLGINPDLPLADADVVVGHDLQVVLYWDAYQAVDYIRLENQLWSPIRSLELSADVDHETAVKLIRELVR